MIGRKPTCSLPPVFMRDDRYDRTRYTPRLSTLQQSRLVTFLATSEIAVHDEYDKKNNVPQQYVANLEYAWI